MILPGNPFCVIYEQVNGISLRKVVENYPLGLEEKFKTKIALDAAKGIAGLHSIYITHRDIRLENIMVIFLFFFYFFFLFLIFFIVISYLSQDFTKFL